MIYRRLGRTNLMVSTIGMGGGVFNLNKDPTLTVEEVNKVISYAVENGVNIIDTGKEYDEKFLSRALEGLKNKLKIATKSEAKDTKSMTKDVDDSLKKLGVGCIDIYQMHMVSSIEDLVHRIKNGVLEALDRAKREGKINFIGIFSHRIEVLIEAVKTNKFDVVTAVYNAGHTRAENLLKHVKRYDVGVIAAATLGNGVLVLPKYGDESYTSGAENMTAEKALKFVLSNKDISTALVGSRNLIHIKENVEIGKKDWNLSELERERIKNNIIEFLGKNFCRGCRYCEPCEAHGGSFPISDILKLKILYEKYGLKYFATNQYLVKKKVYNMPKCVECGKCEPKCPYGVPIVKELKEAREILGGK